MIRVTYTFPYYTDMVEPEGFLGRDKRFHACWTYYVLAQKIKEKVGDSTEDQFGTYEGDLWLDKHYVPVAKSTAIRYGLDTPSDFLRDDIIAAVRLQANSLGFPRPHDEYMRLHPGSDKVH